MLPCYFFHKEMNELVKESFLSWVLSVVHFHTLHTKRNKKILLELFCKKVAGGLFSNAWQEIVSIGVLLQADLEQIISHAEFQQHGSEGTLGEPAKCVCKYRQVY
jgi:hypothetical protein